MSVIVVSGLPRSGTSLLMHMLACGGLSVFNDQNRPPDMHNPPGYFEAEQVKNIGANKAWLYDLPGKAVKIVSPLLKHLPQDLSYRIIFMLRDLDEVIESQEKMLKGKGGFASAEQRWEIKKKFLQHLSQIHQWLNESENMEYLLIHYADLVERPKKNALRIKIFLNRNLKVDQMVAVVNPALYRIRK